ncbi:sodium-coupled monocarboxylate transporter 1 [Hyalella azteca]|uniref:Sodium-coupled monocarboxylate transporter 1 n=1 Tax=Hyalella azteca TaxID=294128 RepID=A0A8B7NZT8_HYAAZ|nr:sodium-coupled monocarboxylate transporter 1 [Hyalella azteca]
MPILIYSFLFYAALCNYFLNFSKHTQCQIYQLKMSTANEVAEFSVVDYCVFIGMLCISMAIGLYHSLKGNKTTEDFLMASRSMSPIPVAFSLTATYLSSISILGIVGEVYGQGLMLAWSLIGNALGIVTATLFIMPVMYPLKLNSVNEYIELRFGSVFLRKLVLVMITGNYLMYLGFCLYAPTLALESVTPIDLTTYIFILGTVVTVYCAFGGLKAVVWTDTFQTVVIILGILVAVIFAVIEVGGMDDVWRIGSENGRTDMLDFRPGLYVRHTMFNTILNGFVTFFTIYGFTQATIQRAGSMPDLARVRLVLFLNAFGLIVLMGILFFTGLAIFAVYAGCDPITLGYISQKDQLLPYYVMDYLGTFKGIPGLFVACLFSGTLSSISSLLSALSSMLWVDFMCELEYFKKSSERVKTITNKVTTLVLGCIMMGFAVLASKLGGLVQATAAVFGALSGPVLGLFVLGVMVPHCSKKGAIAGGIFSTVVMVWLSIGSQFRGMVTVMLPLSIDECADNSSLISTTQTLWTTTTTDLPEDITRPFDFFYGISYTYFSTVGCLSCIVVAVLVSACTGFEKLENVNPSHVLLCLRKHVGHKRSESSASKTKQCIEVATVM